MTRIRLILLAIIVVELAVGGWVLWTRPSSPTPPPADFDSEDSITAAELRGLATDRPPREQWARLGEVELAYGFYPQAEACYRVASGMGTDPEMTFRHAFALERIGKLDEAIARYQSAANAGYPRAADARYYAARGHLRLGHTDAAAEGFASAGELPAARYELARLDFRGGRVDATAREAERLMTEFPRAQQPASLRYRVALLGGDMPTAERWADRFLSSTGRLPNPFDAEFEWVQKAEREFGWKRRLAATAEGIARGKAADAERETTILAAARWTPELADVRSEALYRLGRPDAAVKVLEEAVERAGPNPHLLVRLGDAYATATRPADARQAYERAVRIGTGPKVKDAWARLAEESERAGNAATAKAEWANGLILVGIERLDADRPADAVVALTEATTRDPNSAAGWFFLGEALRAANRKADARTAYDKCLAIDPHHGRAARARKLTG